MYITFSCPDAKLTLTLQLKKQTERYIHEKRIMPDCVAVFDIVIVLHSLHQFQTNRNFPGSQWNQDLRCLDQH